jgi:hypothetical protein
MKFYLVWDKHAQQYMGGTRSYEARPNAFPRVYTTHRHAASAASGWARGGGLLSQRRVQQRKERFEIHEYDVDEYKVVG